LPDKVVEHLVDILRRLGRSFEIFAMEGLVGKRLCLFGRHGSLVDQIALVPDQDHWDVLGVFDLDDLVSNRCQVVECRVRDERKDESKSLPILHVKVTHRRELLCPCSIQDF